MNEVAEIVTRYLGNIIEIVAAIVIGLSLVQFIYNYVRHLLQPGNGSTNQQIRIHFGSSLTIALELLLAADILATAIAPTWDEIGKLASIAVLRTALNYFLERELKTTGERKVA